jgi:hypothetical protein
MVLSTIVSLFLNDVMRDTFMRIQLQGKDALRHHAYNALDALIGHLEHAVICDQIIDIKRFSLPSLQAALPESIKIQVNLVDESGKIPLNNTTQQRLKALFCLFGDLWDGQTLMREYWQWLSRKDSASNLIDLNQWEVQDKRRIHARTSVSEASKDKPDNKVKFPKILLSYDQLREIDKFREFFFDEKGQPNDKMERLKACSSLWNTGAVNINSANKDVLEVLSKSFFLDLDKIENHLGLTEESAKNPQRYKSLREMNELGHANLTLNRQKQNNETKASTKESFQKEDALSYLTIQPHTLKARILVEEADVSFQLNALLEIEATSKESLTKRSKNHLIDMKGRCSVVIKSVSENFL